MCSCQGVQEAISSFLVQTARDRVVEALSPLQMTDKMADFNRQGD